ncbi:MAG: DUF5644 domain-containing protein [Sulfurospirillaceae bacterium]|nr:DUF5644 domain-containing protein [Sulfurospirillaceae bacterium]MDD3462978.1 DUF5644 domain-containing protein [Sulfurospirillaceae bacterium]
MECKLTLSVFRFNARTDFLPYYKKHIITIDSSKKLETLFAMIAKDDATFSYPKGKNSAIKINKKALFTEITVGEIVENFGKELTLEPLSTRRATHDLVINQDDFYAQFDLLDKYVHAVDKELFESYVIYHYASVVHDFVEHFQGPALFAFAYDMIQKYPQNKDSILKIVADENSGVWLHVRLCNKIYPCASEVEKKIVLLKNEIAKIKPSINKTVEKLSRKIDSF